MTTSIRNKAVIVLALMLFVFTGNALAATDSVRIHLIDGERSQTVYAQKGETVENVLADLKLELNNRDGVTPSRDTAVTDGVSIRIDRAVLITVYVDGVPRQLYTLEKTAGALVDSLSKTLGSSLTLEGTDATAILQDDMSLNTFTMATHTVTTSVAIPFETQIVETDELDKGIEQVAQEGSDGLKKIATVQTVKGGQVVSETTTETVEQEAVPAIILRGTRENVVQAGSAGVVEYEYAIHVKATAYSPYDAGCTGITATGTRAGYGTLAVDPRVIPLGSRVYIPGYGIAIASDTGGAIKGNRIDVCFGTQSECYSWGVKNLTIYILK